MESQTPTIATTPNHEQPQWIRTIPHILQARHLHLINQTPKSAAKLHKSFGFFASSPELSHEIERHLFDAFCENDYDGLLHLSTIHEIDDPNCSINEEDCMLKMGTGTHSSSAGNDDDPLVKLGKPIGIVFWREVPYDEMGEWFNFDHIVEQISKHNDGYSNNHQLDEFDRGMNQDGNMGQSLKLVRQASVCSLKRSISTLTSIGDHDNDENNGDSDNNYNIDNAKSLFCEELTHKWIKIELLAVRKEHWGQKVGSLLLACALYHAYLRTKTRAVLHVAGGEENLPAVRLYRHFGFLPVTQGTMFQKPDRDMYVLGNIGRTLEGIAWGDTLGVEDVKL